MINAILGFAAITAIGYYFYYAAIAPKYETSTAINDVPTFAFINPADDTVNPARIGPTRNYNDLTYVKPGQFGIPKTYYKGVGGGTTGTYGNTWSNF